MRHSQDKGKDLHQTMIQIQKSHEEHIDTLTREIRIRTEALRIITGGDWDMINELIAEARERLSA
jgi:hypothetical protein